jgi:hypothetical protein
MSETPPPPLPRVQAAQSICPHGKIHHLRPKVVNDYLILPVAGNGGPDSKGKSAPNHCTIHDSILPQLNQTRRESDHVS